MEDFIPEEDPMVLLHELVLDVEAVPAFLQTVILQRQVLYIEELSLTITISVDCAHLRPRVGPLRINDYLSEVARFDL